MTKRAAISRPIEQCESQVARIAARRSMKVGAEMIPMATNGNSGAVNAQEKFCAIFGGGGT